MHFFPLKETFYSNQEILMQQGMVCWLVFIINMIQCKSPKERKPQVKDCLQQTRALS